MTQTTDAAMQVEQADLLWSRLSADLLMRRVPEGSTLEQRTALALVEAALDTYMSFFYPHEPRQ